ncbi:uncharacterized protein OCT59_011052 [Rhizophagus irregularis]|uniref:uncharacterized protein n=1 Tax=Rhizophagus irregularis TaxID=588596 RepID=UPI003330D5BF|nr:hypothetical protein OCT59_011052 [Rhizophagus irregularis]
MIHIIPNTYLFLCFSFLLLIVKPAQKHIRVITGQSVVESLEVLILKWSRGFNKIRRAIEKRSIRQVCYSFDPSIISANAINDLCLGTDLTETEKGKTVMDKGTHIVFPLKWTTSSKRSGNGRFTNSPNRNADPKEEEVQQYFINECKELDKTPNIKNKLIVVDKHSSPSLGT